mmetsp:Transcript_35295/g.52486  ORF Transcript_35295/g.52486 Transcript_35295/m.52486 type:complete len:240 (+) Transcript_35295:336-1055(+)
MCQIFFSVKFKIILHWERYIKRRKHLEACLRSYSYSSSSCVHSYFGGNVSRGWFKLCSAVVTRVPNIGNKFVASVWIVRRREAGISTPVRINVVVAPDPNCLHSFRPIVHDCSGHDSVDSVDLYDLEVFFQRCAVTHHECRYKRLSNFIVGICPIAVVSTNRPIRCKGRNMSGRVHITVKPHEARCLTNSIIVLGVNCSLVYANLIFFFHFRRVADGKKVALGVQTVQGVPFGTINCLP